MATSIIPRTRRQSQKVPSGPVVQRRGRLFGLVDACAPVPGLVGRYFADVGPKYAKGPNPPWPGDLAFTEFVVFNS